MAEAEVVHPYYRRPRPDEPRDLPRLEALAEFLDGLKPKLFHFNQWMVVPFGALPPKEAFEKGGGCGTVGCAVGWLPLALPEDFTYDEAQGWAIAPIHNPNGRYMEQAAMQVMNLSDREADYLFLPCDHDEDDGHTHGLLRTEARHCYWSGLDGEAKPKDVAKHIRETVAYWRANP